MKIQVFIMIGMMIAQAAMGSVGEEHSAWGQEPTGCDPPYKTELEVHATYFDDGVLMCAVEIESYSWWDLIGRSSWKSDFWFPCDSVGNYTNRGSKVSGMLSWQYGISCHRCKPGRNHTCTASFDIDLVEN